MSILCPTFVDSLPSSFFLLSFHHKLSVFLFFTPQLLFFGISPQSPLSLLHLSLWDWSRPTGSSDLFWFSLLALWTSTWLDQVSSVHCLFDETPLHSHSISPTVAVGEMSVYGCSEASPKCFHFSVGFVAHTRRNLWCFYLLSILLQFWLYTLVLK